VTWHVVVALVTFFDGYFRMNVEFVMNFFLRRQSEHHWAGWQVYRQIAPFHRKAVHLDHINFELDM
jgi:hypothetical protein